MINPLYYNAIYLIVVTVVTIIFSIVYNNSNQIKETSLFSLILCVLLIFFIGFRPEHEVFQDTLAYCLFYRLQEGLPCSFDFQKQNAVFSYLLSYSASNKLGVEFFFTIIAFIYFGGILLSSKLIFPKNTNTAFISYIAALSTFSYATNGIKAGAAASLFLVGIGLYIQNKKILSIFFILLSYHFHHSMSVCIAAFVCTLLYRNVTVYFLFWVFAFFCSFLHVSAIQEFFGYILEDQGDADGAGYLMNGGHSIGGRGGFRFDFIIYSFMPIIIGLYTKFQKGITDKHYDFLLCLYLLLNGVWLLCMYANFTNRIAYLSWAIYPFVLIYPFVHFDFGVKSNRYLYTVVMIHLSFTLFMVFIYS